MITGFRSRVMFSIFLNRSLIRIPSRPNARTARVRNVRRLGRIGWIPFVVPLAALPAVAQEALRNSLAGEAASQFRTQQTQSAGSEDYTFKEGDFRLLLTPKLGFDWNDNVNTSKDDPKDDFIVEPAVGILASYPVTQHNLLFFDVSIGYDWYLKQSDLSTLDLNSNSGTGLSFDTVIKDFTINLHDWISYVQDAAQNATVANTSSYGTFQNTAGLSGTWDLNQVVCSLGYDHQTVLSTSGQFDELDRSAELFSTKAGFQVHPEVIVGLESTAALTTYDKPIFNDNDAYTFGSYVEFHPGDYLKASLHGGYATYQFQHTSETIQTSTENTWYAGIEITHRPRKSINYTFSAGREVVLGEQADLLQDWYARLNGNWKIIHNLEIDTGLFYEHGSQGFGNVTGNFTENFDWYGGTIDLRRQLSRRFSLGLNYRLTLRSSDNSGAQYAQNVVGLELSYTPK